MKLYLADEEATLALGRRVYRLMCPGSVVFLRGTLGAGKTTLVRGLVGAAGYPGAVKSPTFTLVEGYALPSLTIYHFDLYRLASPDELEWFGFRDYLHENSLCLIEWPERGGDALPEPDLRIDLTVDLPGRSAILHADPRRGPDFLHALTAPDRD
ncbi:MAG: tRNA (adenosine(37)-N6)-threonylcarbamoyltransferase complex ATPase subunit type 1 TsaE [Gammaproteobacteria bacterium]|nr:tRNA (adenosine(37)-N6)-threonylcarbamoyltransferase complex ATPase subunit type 1 TsaE [Gammaproteobacteria bacterium]